MILVDAEVAVVVFQVVVGSPPADPDLYPRVRCGAGSVADGDLAASACSFGFSSEAGRQDRGYAASENILQRLAPTDGATGDVSRQLIKAAAPRGVLGH
jgi:hypothetical protein